MAEFIKKVSCPRCRKNGRDASGDNLAVYSDESCHCFSCGYTKVSDEYKKEMGWENEDDEEDDVMTREAITQEENKKIKANTKVVEWRGIREDTAKTFGIRYEIDTATGEPCRQLVPTTIGGDIVGYKSRDFLKDFSRPIGVVGKSCDMIGQFKFQTGGNMVLLVGGEVDQLSAYQMLADDQKARGKDHFEAVAVVSPATGETSAAKQVAAQYEFFDKFNKIIIGFDNDEAGKAATEKLIQALPRGKVYIVDWRLKDPNEYLMAGKEKQFIQDFWKMRKATPAGVIASEDIYKHILERADTDKVAFPPFMEKLNDMLAGGVPKGYLVNIVSGSGSGKSTIMNSVVMDMIINSPYKTGIVSLEAEAGEWGENLLSHYMKKKIALIRDKEEKLDFLRHPDTVAAAKRLFETDDGDTRLYLLDDRGNFDSLQEKIEELIISYGCGVIVIDPCSDVFAGWELDKVEEFMKWEKSIAKQYGTILINVMHTRKTGTGQKSYSQGGMMTEEDIAGHSSQYKSAGIIILLTRDKLAEDDLTRNTVNVFLSKNRACGMTGKVCELYYDNKAHTLYDKEEWLKAQPVPEF